MLKCIVLFGLLSMATLMGQFSPIATTRYNHAIPAKTDHGETLVAARKLLVDVSVPKWHSGKGVLFVLFDTSTGYFHWILGPVPKAQSTAGTLDGYGIGERAYIAGDRLVYFTFGYPHLMIKESVAKANSLDDAEAKALNEAARRGFAMLAYNSTDRVLINLAKLLPQGFFAPPGQPNLGPLKLLDVLHKGNTWEVILEGQWQHRITLDNTYKVTGTTRIN